MHVALALLAAMVMTALADWLFFGVLFHPHYLAFPEVWRHRPGMADGTAASTGGSPGAGSTGAGSTGDSRAILFSALAGLLTPIAMVGLCAWLPLSGGRMWLLALLLWVMIPLPLLVGNYLFIKLHPLILLSHALGWLAKLVTSAAAVVLLL
jgi:hypothetical protein